MITITLPAAEAIAAALVGVNPEPYASQYIYPAIGKTLAGKTYAEAGLSLAWELAVYDAMKGRKLPMVVASVMSLQKDDYLAALKAVCS